MCKYGVTSAKNVVTRPSRSLFTPVNNPFSWFSLQPRSQKTFCSSLSSIQGSKNDLYLACLCLELAHDDTTTCQSCSFHLDIYDSCSNPLWVLPLLLLIRSTNPVHCAALIAPRPQFSLATVARGAIKSQPSTTHLFLLVQLHRK